MDQVGVTRRESVEVGMLLFYWSYSGWGTLYQRRWVAKKCYYMHLAIVHRISACSSIDKFVQRRATLNLRTKPIRLQPGGSHDCETLMSLGGARTGLSSS